jgi:hypothetical protein
MFYSYFLLYIQAMSILHTPNHLLEGIYPFRFIYFKAEGGIWLCLHFANPFSLQEAYERSNVSKYTCRFKPIRR